MVAPVGWSTASNGVRRLPGRTATTRAAAAGTTTAAATAASCAGRAVPTTIRAWGSTNVALHPEINSLHDWISFFGSKSDGHPTTTILTQGPQQLAPQFDGGTVSVLQGADRAMRASHYPGWVYPTTTGRGPSRRSSIPSQPYTSRVWRLNSVRSRSFRAEPLEKPSTGCKDIRTGRRVPGHGFDNARGLDTSNTVPPIEPCATRSWTTNRMG